MDELLLAGEIEKRFYDRKEELEYIKSNSVAHPDYLKRLRADIKAYKTAIDHACF